VTSSGHLLGVQAFLVCPLPSIVDIQTLDEYSGDGEPVVLTVNVSHYQLAHPGRYQLPYAGVPAGAQISVLDLPARSPPASPPAPGRIGMPTCSAYLASGQTDSGLYQVSAESGQAVLAYCDMTTSDGGPYVLLEVGRNLGTNLRTTAAVLGGTTDEGFPEPPMPLAVGVASRKFSRAAQLALYGAGDPPGLRWGNPQVGASAVHFLYAKNLPSECAQFDGCGAKSYGTETAFGANRISLTFGGTTYSVSTFAWPPDHLPGACSNAGGSGGQCSNGCMFGTWHDTATYLDSAFSYYCGGDGTGTLAPTIDDSIYEVWARN